MRMPPGVLSGCLRFFYVTRRPDTALVLAEANCRIMKTPAAQMSCFGSLCDGRIGSLDTANYYNG